MCRRESSTIKMDDSLEPSRQNCLSCWIKFKYFFKLSPHIDGHTEKFNYILEELLCHFIEKNWAQRFDIVQFNFNCQQSFSTGKTPFEVVCMRQSFMSHVIDHPYVGKSMPAYNITQEWKQTSEVTCTYLERES